MEENTSVSRSDRVMPDADSFFVTICGFALAVRAVMLIVLCNF
jgi:hypothetical protein